MTRPIPPSLFERLFGRRGTRRRAPEPADLGTAFGMEQTFDRPEWREAAARADRARGRRLGVSLRNNPR